MHAKCISYFAVAVMKLHDQGNLQKKDFIWSYGSIRLESITMEWSQQVTSMVSLAEAEVSHKHKQREPASK